MVEQEDNWKKEQRWRARGLARAKAVASQLKGKLKSAMNPKKGKYHLKK